MTPQQFQQRVGQWASRLTSSVLPRAEKEVGRSLLLHFQNNFKAGGYESDSSFVPWAKRKYSYAHKPLIKTGHLLDSFKLVQSGNQIQIVNDAPYAEYVSNGTSDTAARPLLYDSKKINKEIEDILTKQLMAMFNS